MNDQELELRLGAWYRAEVDDVETAPLALRVAVDEIPMPARSRSIRRRPILLLAAALVVVGVGGTLAVGSTLVRPPVGPPTATPVAGLTRPTPGPTRLAGPTTVPAASPIGSPRGPIAESGFRAIGAMATARFQHTATALADGRVLIAGGRTRSDPPLATTEFWDPATEAFTAGPQLVVGRYGHTATQLADGRVVIIGGMAAAGASETGTRQIELWDPSTGGFRAAGLTTDPHTSGLSTVLLADGRVLIFGGLHCRVGGPLPSGFNPRPPCRGSSPAAEIWDPATESVTPTGSPLEDHDWAAATLLADGRVYVLGGGQLPTVGSEIWDPATGRWTPGGAPAEARLGSQSDTLLPDGRVLVVGGQTGVLNGPAFLPPLRSAITWDPATSSFSRAGTLETGRERHRAILLADGRVLILGGVGQRAPDFSDTAIVEAEIWDPATGLFSTAGQDVVGRALQTATLLPDGRVLITGGFTRADRGETVDDTASAVIWGP